MNITITTTTTTTTTNSRSTCCNIAASSALSAASTTVCLVSSCSSNFYFCRYSKYPLGGLRERFYLTKKSWKGFALFWSILRLSFTLVAQNKLTLSIAIFYNKKNLKKTEYKYKHDGFYKYNQQQYPNGRSSNRSSCSH